ncbi:serine/threonine-protein kinase [Kribbella sp. NPDC049174]|uniref:serine/threonine-protein kinase n=1 Tax=Kribbella sp. NPDC049174 TaxID=3364112 RepID=UPI00370FB925
MREADEGLVAGRYRLGAVLGRGGMGAVHRATDEVLGREVAVKVMLPVPRTLAAPERFRREARATARIRSPHVVAAYDFGEYGDGYYLAMELVTGCSVADELRRNGLFTAERAEDVVRQAAAGLAAVHRQGIVHRDIKASNLLLTDDGTVKVADFGIVRLLDDATTTLTSTGQIVGTSHYLSPERVLGKPAEPPSDIYALGCVLYQLVAGRPPFMADSPAAIMYQHVQNEPVPPSKLRPELADLEPLIFWMLDKDPVRRPTAAEIADAAVPPTIVDPAAETISLTARRTTSRPVLAGVAAAIALTASASVGLLLDTRGVELTEDLRPGGGAATTPAVVPGTSVKPQTARPTTTTPSERPSTKQPLGVNSKPGVATVSPKTKKSANDADGKSADRGKGNKPHTKKSEKKP